jgi:hypothetical protein
MGWFTSLRDKVELGGAVTVAALTLGKVNPAPYIATSALPSGGSSAAPVPPIPSASIQGSATQSVTPQQNQTPYFNLDNLMQSAASIFSGGDTTVSSNAPKVIGTGTPLAPQQNNTLLFIVPIAFVFLLILMKGK